MSYHVYVLTLALAFRVVWALIVPVVPVSDSVVYDTMARHIAMGHGASLQPLNTPEDKINHSAYWPVGAPAIFAAAYAIFGFHYWPVVIINIMANLATIWLVMLMTEVWLSRNHSLVAGLLLALWPSQIQFSTVIASEHLFGFFIMLAIYCWVRFGERSWMTCAAVGVSLAVACLIRPTALLVPGLLFITSLPYRKDWLRMIAGLSLSAAVMVASILPWSFYNQSQFGQFVLISTNGGPNLWMGNHPGTRGGYTPLPDEVRGKSEIERNQYLSGLAKAYIRKEPFEFVTRTLVKLVRLHERESIGVSWNEEGISAVLGSGAIIFLIKLITNIYWWLMLVLGIAGLWLYGKSSGLLHLFAFAPFVFWGYFAAVHAVIVIQDRYHFPSIPFIAVLASIPIMTAIGMRYGLRLDSKPLTGA